MVLLWGAQALHKQGVETVEIFMYKFHVIWVTFLVLLG